jgi:uroporphyrin-3 C-methyltransferase
MSAEIESLVTDDAARRVGGASPMVVVLALVALLAAGYAHWRMSRVAGALEIAQAQLAELQGTRAVLAAQQSELTGRLEASVATLRAELGELRELATRVDELNRSQAELLARTESPQRAWVRAEALYLLDLANRRLDLEGDVRTAIVAMESADARLAALDDPALTAVRNRLAVELAALRAAPQPDLAEVLKRLGNAESRARSLPVLGTPISAGRRTDDASDSSNGWARAWRRLTAAARDLFSLRRVEPMTARLVTQEEEALRRQHLELLLVAARVAAMQGNGAAYTQALQSAVQWLEQGFDPRAQAVLAERRELGVLATMTVEAPRPGIGAAAQLLRRTGHAGAARP